MGTLREYFDTDFSRVMNVTGEIRIAGAGQTAKVSPRVHMDHLANAAFISCFVPAGAPAYLCCKGMIEHAAKIIDSHKGLQVLDGHPGADPEDMLDSTTLRFTGRMYFYVEDDLSAAEINELRAQAAAQNLSMFIRQRNYASQRSAWEKPLAFVCHDSRDKDAVARPIALGLSKQSCPVWYDEYSLKVGDRLREAIETGLKECKKCVLIISPNFLSNGGWTRTEFNSIFTREILDRDDIILPIWHGVSQRDVFEYSPSLADRVAIDWSRGEENVVRRIYHAITRPTG